MPQHAVPCCASCSARAAGLAQEHAGACPCPVPLPAWHECTISLALRCQNAALGPGSVQARFPRAVGGCWHSPLGSQTDKQTDRQTCPGQERSCRALCCAEPACGAGKCPRGTAQGGVCPPGRPGLGLRWAVVPGGVLLASVLLPTRPQSTALCCTAALRGRICTAVVHGACAKTSCTAPVRCLCARRLCTVLVHGPCAGASCPAPVQAAGGCSPVPRGGSTHRAMPAPGSPLVPPSPPLGAEPRPLPKPPRCGVGEREARGRGSQK